MAPQALATSTQQRPEPGLVSADGRTYPLRSAHIRARAEGGLALTTLVQEFHNPHEESLEVAYTMPLPADGAVLGYTITMGERIIRGEIEIREQAEKRYRDALYKGQTAGLLEQDRADTFQQRLGNIPARTDVRVEIDVLQPLAFLGAGELAGTDGPATVAAPSWEYRFPTVAGVRYQGAPGRVPDSERLDPNRAMDGGIPTRFGLSLTVADEIAGYGGVASPSHGIVASESAEGTNVRLADEARLDRDLVVRWAATTPAVGVRVVEGKGVGGDDGRYALVSITPPGAPGAVHPRDLTVLIDSSGSMSGQPIELAKGVVEALLRGLGEGDRFEVLSFASRVDRLTRGVVSATPGAIERAVRDVRGISAGGSTEMVGAMAEALCRLRPDSQRQVVLVSDGQIGFEGDVISRLRNLPAGVRVHVVGIGAAPNRSLTAFLALAGRGVELIANDATTAAEAAARLRAATARPVLTEIFVGGPAVRGVAPSKPRDVLAGQPLVLAVELAGGGGALDVSGNLAGSGEVWGWRVEVGAAGAAGAGPQAIATTPLPIGALYGRESIADLEAQADPGWPADADVACRIEALGLRHRITSRRTSLVAILEEPAADPRAPRRRERLAVELPDGVSAEGVGLFATAGIEGVRGFREFAPARSVLLRAPSWGKGRVAASEGIVGEPPGVLLGTLVQRDGAEIILEIEVPADGYILPAGVARVEWGGRKIGKARVLPDKSTVPGPHPRGVLVRLALRMEGGKPWPEMAEIRFDPRGARALLPGPGPRGRVTILFGSPATGPAPGGRPTA